MALVTGVYYALDLAIQGTCRSLYDDQPYLINVLASQYMSMLISCRKKILNLNRTINGIQRSVW